MGGFKIFNSEFRKFSYRGILKFRNSKIFILGGFKIFNFEIRKFSYRGILKFRNSKIFIVGGFKIFNFEIRKFSYTAHMFFDTPPPSKVVTVTTALTRSILSFTIWKLHFRIEETDAEIKCHLGKKINYNFKKKSKLYLFIIITVQNPELGMNQLHFCALRKVLMFENVGDQ